MSGALHINETAYGPDHPHVASTLTNLAEALRDLGEPATARPLLERALHINETTYGPDHPASVRLRQRCDSSMTRPTECAR